MTMEATGLVTYRLDPDHPPVLSDEERQVWKDLKEMPDSAIDFSDIPPQPRTGWRRVSDLVPYVTAQKKAL